MKNSITVYSRYYRVISALFWGSIQHWQNISFAPKQHKYLRIEPTQRGLTAITFVSITPLKQRIFDRRLLSGFSTKILTVSSDTSPLIANVASLNYNWPILRNIGMLNQNHLHIHHQTPNNIEQSSEVTPVQIMWQYNRNTTLSNNNKALIPKFGWLKNILFIHCFAFEEDILYQHIHY